MATTILHFGLPWWLSEKILPTNAGDTGSIPDLGSSHMPTQLSLGATTIEPVLGAAATEARTL